MRLAGRWKFQPAARELLQFAAAKDSAIREPAFQSLREIGGSEVQKGLAELAGRRGQTLAQMAIAWILRGGKVTSALVGARTVEQLDDTLKALDNLDFSPQDLAEIDRLSLVEGRDLWRSLGLLNPILR